MRKDIDSCTLIALFFTNAVATMSCFNSGGARAQHHGQANSVLTTDHNGVFDIDNLEFDRRSFMNSVRQPSTVSTILCVFFITAIIEGCSDTHSMRLCREMLRGRISRWCRLQPYQIQTIWIRRSLGWDSENQRSMPSMTLLFPMMLQRSV